MRFNRLVKGTPTFFLVFLLCLSAGCGREKHDVRFVLAQGLVLPGITALAFESGTARFVSISEDGLTRVWDLYAGLVSVSQTTSPGSDLDFAGFPVFSPEGTRKIFPADDGAICLADAATGKELARYYAFGPDEWLSITSEGFYNASLQGSSFIDLHFGARHHNLSQLSGALFRPDLFNALLVGDSRDLPVSLPALFREDRLPPQVSLSLSQPERELGITITEQKGGVGLLALYYRVNGEEIPAGILDIQHAAAGTRQARRRTVHEISVNLNSWPQLNTYSPVSNTSNISGEIGVSAFNSSNTVESARVWVSIPPLASAGAGEPDTAPGELPVLRALLAVNNAGEDARKRTAALEDLLSSQAEGDLYSVVEVKSLYGEEFTSASFIQALEGLRADSGKDDVVLLYLQAAGEADALGDLCIIAGKAGEEIIWEQVLRQVLGLSKPILLLDMESHTSPAGLKTALLRFRQRLGPRAMFAGFGMRGKEDSFFDSVMEGLAPVFSDTGGRYIEASDFLDRAGQTLAEQGRVPQARLPLNDFRIADRLVNAGELRFQSMASGMLRIDRVDDNPVPLNFGHTLSRILPAASYIIDIFYRNGFRETRMVNLRKGESVWVVFNYVPPRQYVGDFSAAALSQGRSSRGINISELNPANYQRIDRIAMETMGMAPAYVAFLAGERLYQDGQYANAIAEYSRAISLRSGYLEAHVSRGNAYRRSGQLDRAIADYSRALALNSGHAEIYNYRGFVHAQMGDLNRAIADYTLAIRLRADYADAFFNRAHAYMQQGGWDRAIADYTQVIRLEPSNASAYNQRGNAHQRRGDRERASADYAAAERLR